MREWVVQQLSKLSASECYVRELLGKPPAIGAAKFVATSEVVTAERTVRDGSNGRLLPRYKFRLPTLGAMSATDTRLALADSNRKGQH